MRPTQAERIRGGATDATVQVARTGQVGQPADPGPNAAQCAGVFVCLLGGFRIFRAGSPMRVPSGGKVEQVLGHLAMHPRHGLSREELLERVWPASDLALASQSLSTLNHWLKRQLSDALSGEAPIVRRAGRCALNTGPSLTVDLLEFDAAMARASMHTSAGNEGAAIQSYESALDLYGGDLWVGSDIRQLLERERLRAAYLTARARLGDHYFQAGRYDLSIQQAYELLAVDPFREDAHRMAMRCYVRSNQRAQALRQYQTCRELLQKEFDAIPEPATDALYDRIRWNPGTV
jgi:DNA-binding SARP family transcriptional activator